MSMKLISASLSGLVFIAGCNATATPPRPEYSPGYSYVSTGAGGSAKGASGSILAPDACLNDGIDDDVIGAANNNTIVDGTGRHLAPGCANAYNLQQMVESERDLVEGRRMGPSHAAPSVRAAQRYLYGEPIPAEAPSTQGSEGL